MQTVTQGYTRKKMALMSLKEADKVFPLFDFFLYFVTGGCNFCLCGEDSTEKGEDCATNGCIKSPAQGAVSRFVGWRIVSAVAYGLLAAPARWVEYQTEDEEEACRVEEKTGEHPPRLCSAKLEATQVCHRHIVTCLFVCFELWRPFCKSKC